MMRALLLGLLLLHGGIAHGTEGKPTGQNCNLSAPPKGAGEEFNHGITLKVYPRARDMGATYTGCQTLWMPDGKKWQVISVTVIKSGDPVRIWSPVETDPVTYGCTYEKGRVIKGHAPTCVAPEVLIKKSLSPGCVERIAKSGTFPAGCKYE